jgi:hypothetical protein
VCTLAGFTMRDAIDVLDAQAQTFEQPEAPAVREGGHQPYGSLELREQMLDLSASQYDRQVLWPLCALDALDPRQALFQYFAIQERMALSA